MENKSTYLTIRLSEKMLDKLDSYAKKHRISRSGAVKQLLEQCYTGRPTFAIYAFLYKNYVDEPYDKRINVRISQDLRDRTDELEKYYMTFYGELVRKLIVCYAQS